MLDLYEREGREGVIVSMGGQIPNNLALQLAQGGRARCWVRIRENIDRAEDRSKFGALLDELGIDQPQWFHVTDRDEAHGTVRAPGRLSRFSFAQLCAERRGDERRPRTNELLRILERAKDVSPEHPVVVSKFETHAREIEIDAVADNGDIVLWAISEHIEDAGVHSGDATLVLPPQTLYIATIRRVKQIAAAVARALRDHGAVQHAISGEAQRS